MPPKGKVWISFDKPNFVENEPVVGKVNIEANEYIQSIGVKVEARVFENYTEMVWVTINNQRFQQPEHRQNALFSRDVQVSGPADFGKGPTQTFPFSVAMPVCRPTRSGGSIENSLKAVVQVKGRPDMTGHTQVAFAPASSVQQPMPGYMPQPGGYPMPQGYGPPGYGPQPGYGYNPNPAYGPPMPGYGQQSVPGYGPQQVPQQQQQATGPQVRCKYCTALMNANANNCPNCGAHQ
jgi:hypothetical protein